MARLMIYEKMNSVNSKKLIANKLRLITIIFKSFILLSSPLTR